MTRAVSELSSVRTGQLGDVMKESANLARSYLRAQATRYGIDASFFDQHPIHIHFVPAGATPKRTALPPDNYPGHRHAVTGPG